MFKKGYYNHSFFKKGDMSQQDRLFGNYRSPHMVHSWIKADNFDLKGARKAGNALEKRHK